MSDADGEGSGGPWEPYAAYQRLNRRFFDGELPQDQEVLVAGNGSGGSYNTVNGRITVSAGLVSGARLPGLTAKGRADFATDVLLHEMCHLHVALHGGEGTTRSGNRRPSHGLPFTCLCNRIGPRLGLPPVRASGTGRTSPDWELPISSRWPHCVRPAGYYAGLSEEEMEGWGDTVASRDARRVSRERRRLQRQQALEELADNKGTPRSGWILLPPGRSITGHVPSRDDPIGFSPRPRRRLDWPPDIEESDTTRSAGNDPAYDVILDDPGPCRVRVIKTIRLITGLKVGDARELIRRAPWTVLAGVPDLEALEAEEQLNTLGASVRIDQIDPR